MKKIIITLALLISLIEHSSAQWKPTNGPYGGGIRSLAIADNGYIYAGTFNAGIFVSKNNGENWAPINNGITNYYIKCIATSGSYIYAGTDGGGIFKSSNNGDSWVEINKGLKYNFITGIVISENIVFVSVVDGTENLTHNNSGIYSSTDFGENWKEIDIGLNKRSERIRNMSISGTNLVLNFGRSLFVSSDKGITWKERNGFGINNYSTCLINKGDTIIIGVQHYNTVLLSTDNGDNWKEINSGIEDFYALSLFIANNIVYLGTYEGFYKSTNYGESWIEFKNGIIDNYIRSFAFSGNIIYAGSSSGGVYASSDNGENWESKNNGLTNSYIEEITILDNYIYTSTGGGIFKSLKNSNIWTETNNGLTKNNLRIFTTIGKNIIAGTLDNGIYLSSNGGQSWNESNSGLSNKMILCLDNDGENIYAGTYLGGLFVSHDFGLSWNSLLGQLQDSVIFSVSIYNNNIFVVTEKRGILLSSDKGKSWEEINFAYYIDYLKFIYVNYDYIFAVERSSLLLSTDKGINWKTIKGSKHSSLYYIGIDCPFKILVIDSLIVVGDRIDGISFTTNKGETWHVANIGLTNKFIRSLAILDNTIYVGTAGGGVFQANINDFFSSVSGRVLKDGMPLANITISTGSSTVTTDANGNFTFSDLVVGEQEITPHAVGYSFTPSSYKINLLIDTAGLVFNAEKVISSLEIGDSKSFIKSIYPQPSASKLQISLEATIGDEIKIYSIDGVEVYKQVFTKLTDYLEIDTSSLPSGAYLLELSTQHGKETQNVLIQK